MQSGANVNVFDASGSSALDKAVDNRDLKMSELLLANGAVNETADDSVNPIYKERRNSTDTSLYSATLSGNIELVRLLIRWGANINRSTQNGPTNMRASDLGRSEWLRHSHAIFPFRHSLEVENVAIAKLLLAGGMDKEEAKRIIESMLVELGGGLFVGILNIDSGVRQRRLEAIHAELCNVSSLKELCRFTTRKAVKDIRNMNSLPLPGALISYLWMDEI